MTLSEQMNPQTSFMLVAGLQFGIAMIAYGTVKLNKWLFKE